MDTVISRIVDFATRLHFADLPAEVVSTAELRISDSVGCALGAVGAPPSRLIASLVDELAAPNASAARVLTRTGAVQCPPELAAFANTSLIRYLDLNDWSPNGHPSDSIGGLLAMSAGRTGSDLVLGTVVAYEVSIAFTSAARVAAKGFDQGFAIALGTVAGLGAMLGLSGEVLANAIGIVAASGLPFAVTRSGELSMWKSSATAYATRNAVFAVELARAGMSGPTAAFDGRRGVKEVSTGPFDLALAAPGATEFRISGTALKYWPVCYHAQAAAWAAAELAPLVRVDELTDIEVRTYAEAWRSTGSEPEKWRPSSRETADHSTPWVVARILRDGRLTAESFTDEQVKDPAVVELMSKISVVADAAASARFPREVIAQLSARDAAGREYEARVVNPAGHPDNPLSDEDARAKFLGLAGSAGLTPAKAEEARQAWSSVAAVASLDAAFDSVAMLA